MDTARQTSPAAKRVAFYLLLLLLAAILFGSGYFVGMIQTQDRLKYTQP